MAFSIFGIFAVLLEFIRPFLPVFVAVIIIELVLLAVAMRKSGLSSTLGALKSTMPIGVIGFIAGLLFAPWLTGASHGNLAGILDWLSLVGASAGLGVVAMLLVWPPLALLRRPTA